MANSPSICCILLYIILKNGKTFREQLE